MMEKKEMSYHEYKNRLKKLMEEIKKEKRKASNRNKKGERLIKLEEELCQLQNEYEGSTNTVGGKNEAIQTANGINNDLLNPNVDELNEKHKTQQEEESIGELYAYNEKVSKKAQKNKKKMKQLEELEEQRERERLENNHGEVEYNTLLERLKKLNKEIYPIAADGNCLYESILHQLKINKKETYEYTVKDFLNLIGKSIFSLKEVHLMDYQNKNDFDFSIFSQMNPDDLDNGILRFITAVYLLQNESSFTNFIYCSQDNFDENTLKETYFRYCQDIINGVYGSEIEIKALSNIFQKKIVVYDVNLDVSYGKDYSEELFLSFHHKLYALGKHYNSVIDIST